MIRDELSRALEILGDRLPDGELVLLVRRAFGDRGVTFIRGDVETVTGHPASVFESSVDRWIEIVHPEDRETLRERLVRLTDTEESRLEYRVLEPNGGVRWIRERLQVVRTDPEAPPAVVGVLRDISFERTSRARIAGLEKELWRSRKMEAIGSMTSGIAHDFNNLLTVILSSADLLRHDPDIPEDSLEDVRVLRQAAHRGAKLVQQILRLGSERRGTVETIPVGDFVHELEGILRKVAGSRVEVSLDVCDDVGSIQADRTHLEQILLNLAANARDAMPAGGHLGIRVESRTLEERLEVEGGTLRPGSYVCLTVRDTGVGMTPSVREHIFEPFFSTKTSEEGRTGGFGLSNVLRLVRGYGGGIHIESEEGRGAEFQVYFPVREELDGAVREALAAGHVEAPERHRARVLMVDADPSVRKVVKRVLERDGHTVVTAGTAAEGLQAFDRVRPPFDLLLADVVLPDRSGYDLWRALDRRVDELPVIFMSGYDRQTMVDVGVAPSEANVLTKPLNPRDLRDTVLGLISPVRRDGPDLPSASEG